MTTLTLHRKLLPGGLAIPYWVYVDDQLIGIMQSKEESIVMPAGSFDLSVRVVLGPPEWHLAIGGTQRINLAEGEHLHLLIADKERWWNLLFNIDIVLWLAKLLFTLPHPWDMAYEVLSNGFFVVWSIRVWIIRKRYFQLRPC